MKGEERIMDELDMRVKCLLRNKIEEVITKGDVSPSEMQCVESAYKTIGQIETIEAMHNYNLDDYSSFNRGFHDNMTYRLMHTPNMRMSWDDDISMRRMKGGSSYHSVNDKIIASLELGLDDAKSDFERQKIMDEISRLRSMKD